MDKNKYIVEDDSEIFDSGFSGKSKYDEEREVILEKLDKYSHKRLITTLSLCFFLGIVGAHHFVNGRILRGFLYLFTLGFCGIGWIFDMIVIIAGRFKDGNGKYINDLKVMSLQIDLERLDQKYASGKY